GRVAVLLEEFRQGDLARAKVYLAARRDPGEDAVAMRGAASQDRRPRRRADCAGRVAQRQSNTLLGERVQVRSLYDGVAVAAEVAVAEVVGEEEDDVGGRVSGSSEADRD